MAHWLIKSAIHRAISWLPMPQFWNGLLQTYVTHSTRLTRPIFEAKVRECHRHLEAFSAFHPPKPDFTVLELGTGWLPIIPIGLYLCGAREVWTVDIEPLLRPTALEGVLTYFCESADAGDLSSLLPRLLPERIEPLRELRLLALSKPPAKVLEAIRLHVLVADAQTLPVAKEEIDFIVSSGVLEYIPLPVLRGIMTETGRVSRVGSIMSHRLNLVDQFSYFDSSITPFNFLRFTGKQWRWRNSPLIWQNRLRISDYRRLLLEAGFELLREENTSGSAADLARVTLAPEFQQYSAEDLLVLHSFLTARRLKL